MTLEILYEDPQLIAINKPHGLLVHRTALDKYATEFALQILRDQIGQRVYPIHRLDRKTSGVLLLAKSPEIHKAMSEMWAERQVLKKYIAIVRGHTEDSGVIDYPLKNESDTLQDAWTEYITICRSEIDLPLGKFPTSRYSLVRLVPITGRMHQLRRHMSHIFHPIIGDRPHGCNKQNKLFKERFGMESMMLHAESLTFNHPLTNEKINIFADTFSEFKRMVGVLSLPYSVMNG